jgi:hypothetical protein
MFHILMVLFNVNITDVESAYNTPISNFAIVSIKSSSRNILCKVDQTIDGASEKKIIYFSYYPRTMTEQFLFLEIFNESPLWQYKCEYVLL